MISTGTSACRLPPITPYLTSHGARRDALVTQATDFSCAAQLKSPYALRRDDDIEDLHDQASTPACRQSLGDWHDRTSHHEVPPHHHPHEGRAEHPPCRLCVGGRKKSPFEKYRACVEIETTPDERRVLNAAHLASIALRRTFVHWVKVGRGLQLLREKADQIGTRNAFNDLRDQHRLGDKHFRKEVVSRLLKVMDNIEAVEAWRATLTEKQRLEWSSPDTVFRRCPVFKKPKAATAEVRPSPYARLQQANAELQIELHEVKRRAADGDLFDLENDRIETIAGTIIEKVGIDKAMKIARAILNSPEGNE